MSVFNLFRKKKSEEKQPATSKFIDDEWLEVSAESRDEAIERACVALNTNPTHLEIKMLSKDGKKLRARKVAPDQERPTKTSQPAGESSRQPRQQRQSRSNPRGQQARPSRGPAPQSRPTRGSASKSRNRNDHNRVDEQTDETNMNAIGNDDNYSHSDRDRSHDYYNDRNDRQAKSNHVPREEEVFEPEVEDETDLGRKAKDVLFEIAKRIDENCTVELYETNKTIRLEIVSQESGLFIGKFGQTLDSIQLILKKILEIKFEDQKNLIVDAEHYRVRREESIETKARKLAKKARQDGRPVSVEPMNAMDRRIVHMALKGEPGIETKSVGEGSSRRVLIVPKGRSSGGRDDGDRGGRGYQGRGRGNGNRDRQPAPRSLDSNARVHDSYDVPALSKSEVFGDNPEEYFDNSKYDEEN